MEYFDQILHKNACQHYLTTSMCNRLFDGRAFAGHFSQLQSVSENAHNSWTARYIWLHMHFFEIGREIDKEKKKNIAHA